MNLSELYNHKHKLSNSPLYIRILYVIPAFVMAFLSGSLLFNVIVIVSFLLLTQIITDIQLKRLIKLYSYPLVFIVFGCITIAFTLNSSSPLFTFFNWQFGFDSENMMLSFHILSRSLAIICVTFFGLLTHSVSEISAIMKTLRVPNLFVELFLLTYKFIFELSFVSNMMYTAQVSRGAYMGKSDLLKAFSMLSSAVFRNAILQCNRVAIAIDVRLGDEGVCFLRKENCFRVQQLFVPVAFFIGLLISFLILMENG